MNHSVEIKVGICIAYDWEMLKISLPIIYSHVDKVCLSIDKNRRSWSGNIFEFDEKAFFEYVKSIDIDNKIQIYEDDFAVDSSNPMKGEVYQRNKMAEVLGSGGWHIQIDVDEYFCNILGFVAFLKYKFIFFSKKDVNICLPVYTLFKKTEDNCFIVRGEVEWFTIATNKPYYEFGRRNSYYNYYYYSPIIHQSWAREPHEIFLKINNWGHKNDFDGNLFFKNWESLGVDNYKTWKNFHPIDNKIWKELVLFKANNINELMLREKELNKLHSFIRVKLLLKNNRFVAKLLQVLKIKW